MSFSWLLLVAFEERIEPRDDQHQSPDSVRASDDHALMPMLHTQAKPLAQNGFPAPGAYFYDNENIVNRPFRCIKTVRKLAEGGIDLELRDMGIVLSHQQSNKRQQYSVFVYVFGKKISGWVPRWALEVGVGMSKLIPRSATIPNLNLFFHGRPCWRKWATRSGHVYSYCPLEVVEGDAGTSLAGQPVVKFCNEQWPATNIFVGTMVNANVEILPLIDGRSLSFARLPLLSVFVDQWKVNSVAIRLDYLDRGGFWKAQYVQSTADLWLEPGSVKCFAEYEKVMALRNYLERIPISNVDMFKSFGIAEHVYDYAQDVASRKAILCREPVQPLEAVGTKTSYDDARILLEEIGLDNIDIRWPIRWDGGHTLGDG